MNKMKLILATRGSKLALAQAALVRQDLMNLAPSVDIELKVIRTRGDSIQNVPLSEVGGKGLFTRELETALLDGSVDLAVHSMKDFPSDIPSGLRIGCIPRREVAYDVIISRKYSTLEEIPVGAVVGTGSLRRQSILMANGCGFTIKSIRGNVETRLRKLDEGKYDAILLAAAGLNRLGLRESNTIVLDGEFMIPAAGQGALCIEIAQNSRVPLELLDEYNDTETSTCVALERAALGEMGASCQVPVGVHAVMKTGCIQARGCLAAPDGGEILFSDVSGEPARAEILGNSLARNLLQNGGKKILDAIIHS
ncbi:hydroxymethylbilane synthase [Planctomycetota bacterium]